MQILVVDDSSFARGIIIRELESMGVESSRILQASNGKEALDKLKTHEVGLLFLDIFMPGIDGITVLKEIMRSRPEVNVVICSSHSSKATAKELIDLGAKDFLVKPFPPGELKKVAAHYLGKAAG